MQDITMQSKWVESMYRKLLQSLNTLHCIIKLRNSTKATTKSLINHVYRHTLCTWTYSIGSWHGGKTGRTQLQLQTDEIYDLLPLREIRKSRPWFWILLLNWTWEDTCLRRHCTDFPTYHTHTRMSVQMENKTQLILGWYHQAETTKRNT